MLRNALIPVDGSAESEAVFHSVAALHRATGCAATIAHVVPASGAAEDRAAWPCDPAGAAARLRALGVAEVHCVEVRSEAPADGILEAGAKSLAELIAMSPYAEGGFIRSLLGSVTLKVIARAKVPILTVRADAALGPATGGLFDRVLVAVDGSERSLRIIPCVRTMAGELTPKLRLLYVSHPGEGELETAAEDDDAIVGARRLAESAGLEVGCEVIPGRDIVDTVLKAAKRFHATLVAIASHGRSAALKLVLGSVADGLVRKSPLPVLIVK